jgi:hypothetical protein
MKGAAVTDGCPPGGPDERTQLLAVLEDRLLDLQRLPDDLCPTASVAAALEVGGELGRLAHPLRQAFALAWFGGEDPCAVWAALRAWPTKQDLGMYTIERALRFHTASHRQLAAAGYEDSVSGAQGCRTMSEAPIRSSSFHSFWSVFALGGACAWVESQEEARRRLSPLQSAIAARWVPLEGEARARALPQWFVHGEQLVRAWEASRGTRSAQATSLTSSSAVAASSPQESQEAPC